MCTLITYVSTVRGVNVLDILKNEKVKSGGFGFLKNGIASEIHRKHSEESEKQKTKSGNSSLMNTQNNGNQINVKSFTKSHGVDKSADDEVRTSQALYVIGRTAERTAPQHFVHFPMGDAFSSKIMLPYVHDVRTVLSLDNHVGVERKRNVQTNNSTGSNGGTSNYGDTSCSANIGEGERGRGGGERGERGGVSGEEVTVCVCAWLQLGALSSSPTSSLCQLVLPYPALDGNSDNIEKGDISDRNDGDSNDNMSMNATNSNKKQKNKINEEDDSGTIHDDVNTKNILQPAAMVVDIFYRIIHKIDTSKKEKERDEEIVSVASGESYRGNPYTQNDDFRNPVHQEEGQAKRMLQLCVSHNGVLEETSAVELGPSSASFPSKCDTNINDINIKNVKTDDNDDVSREVGDEKEVEKGFERGSAHLNQNESNRRTSKGEWSTIVDDLLGRSDSKVDSGINGPRSREFIATETVNKNKNKNENDEDKENENENNGENEKSCKKDENKIKMSAAMTRIASSIVRHSVPDAVIECDWAERGDWHLVCLSLTLSLPSVSSQSQSGATLIPESGPSSGPGIGSHGDAFHLPSKETPKNPTPFIRTPPPIINCWVDGKAKNVLKWSALGYRLDEDRRTHTHTLNRTNRNDKEIQTQKSGCTTVAPSISSATGGSLPPLESRGTRSAPHTSSPSSSFSAYAYPLRVCVGGLCFEQQAYSTAVSSIQTALRCSYEGNNQKDASSGGVGKEVNEGHDKDVGRKEGVEDRQTYKLRDNVDSTSTESLEERQRGCKGKGCIDRQMDSCTLDKRSTVSKEERREERKEEREQAMRDLSFLQAHSVLVGGFSGSIGNLCVLNNIPTERSMAVCAKRGPGYQNSFSLFHSPCDFETPIGRKTTTNNSTLNKDEKEKEKYGDGKNERDIECENENENENYTENSHIKVLTSLIPNRNVRKEVEKEVEVLITEKENDAADLEVAKQGRDKSILSILTFPSLRSVDKENDSASIVTRVRGASESSLLHYPSGDTGYHSQYSAGLPLSRQNSNGPPIESIGEREEGAKEKEDSGAADGLSLSSPPLPSSTSTSTHQAIRSPSLRTRIMGANILSSFFSSPARHTNATSSTTAATTLGPTPAPTHTQGAQNAVLDTSHPLDCRTVSLTPVNEVCGVYGDVTLHLTSGVSDAVSSLGGLKILYPLLVTDRTRQVACVRVIASMLCRPDMYVRYLRQRTDKVLLYCCYTTPAITSTETLQVLFDLATSLSHTTPSLLTSLPHSLPHGGGDVLGSSSGDNIQQDIVRNASMLSLICDVATSSMQNIQIARVTIDWLRCVCDDVCANNRMVLKSIGITPVLIILSLWTVGGNPLHFGIERGSARGSGGDRSMRKTEGLSVFDKTHDGDENRKKTNRELKGEQEEGRGEGEVKGRYKEIPDKSIPAFSISQYDGNRLQQSCSRFLKQLLTGTSGDQSARPGSEPSGIPGHILDGPGYPVGNKAGSSIFSGNVPVSGAGKKSNGETSRSSLAGSTVAVMATSTGFTVSSMVLLLGFIRTMHE